jgi:hypothetical protein
MGKGYPLCSWQWSKKFVNYLKEEQVLREGDQTDSNSFKGIIVFFANYWYFQSVGEGRLPSAWGQTKRYL